MFNHLFSRSFYSLSHKYWSLMTLCNILDWETQMEAWCIIMRWNIHAVLFVCLFIFLGCGVEWRKIQNWSYLERNRIQPAFAQQPFLCLLEVGMWTYTRAPTQKTTIHFQSCDHVISPFVHLSDVYSLKSENIFCMCKESVLFCVLKRKLTKESCMYIRTCQHLCTKVDFQKAFFTFLAAHLSIFLLWKGHNLRCERVYQAGWTTATKVKMCDDAGEPVEIHRWRRHWVSMIAQHIGEMVVKKG